MLVSDIEVSRWKGFNLLGCFTSTHHPGFERRDFATIRRLGFTFVRLPLSYRLWLRHEDPFAIDFEKLRPIEEALAWAEQEDLHVCLNLHRAPGFSVATDQVEPFNLWKDAAAERAFLFHWQTLAEKFGDYSSRRLSFNLVNEPEAPGPLMDRDDYLRVMKKGIQVIRGVSPHRPIVIDGLAWGGEPLPELLPLDVIQSCRGYVPLPLTHYKAKWVRSEGWDEPAWPGIYEGVRWDAEQLSRWYQPWVEFQKAGGMVHCGEFGCYHKTSHSVALSWMADLLAFFGRQGWGWALWNFTGPFGIVNSERSDVQTRLWRGYRLDRQMLDLLARYRE
jgi:endoglucanase